MSMGFRLLSCIALLLCSGTSALGQDGAEPRPVTQEMPEDSAVPRGRLGDAVRPRGYRLDLTLDPARPRFSGEAAIDVTLEKPTRAIWLHGRDLAVSTVRATLPGGRVVEGQWRQVDPGGVARITFEEALPAGEASLAITYDAAFSDGPSGLFRVQVEGQWYVWSQFQSIDARAAFPGFDQPDFKTSFTLTLRTPPAIMAVGNAPELGGPPEIVNGLAVHRFAPTGPLPTYLVAIMAGPFASLAGQVAANDQREAALPLRVVSPAPNAGKLDFALEGTAQITVLMEDYFGEAFPFAKLDQVTSPILPGAMENAGAALYRDDIIVMGPDAPVRQQREFGVIVAHELGHQWFGNLVTPDWWDDIWLNESFANWIGYRMAQAWRPDLAIRGEALADGYRAMEVDSLLSGRPVQQEIAASAEIDSAFDSITYGKGGHVVGMIAAWLGEDTFRDGVRRYIAAHREVSATSEDFFHALAEVAGDERLVPALRSFVVQQGVPLLAMHQRGDSVSVTQLRYTPAGVATPEALWTIPLCFRRGEARTCVVMEHRNQTFTVPGDGVVFPNAGGAGYYRFELAEGHWDALLRDAASLPGGEAQALVDSLGASIRAGRGTIAEMAQLARRLIDHPDPHAADAADKVLSRLVMEGIVGARGRRGFRRFREHLYAPLLKEFGFDPRAGAYAREKPARIQRRAQVVAALLGTAKGGDLRDALDTAMAAYLEGDRAALDAAWLDHGLDIYLFERDDTAARNLVDRALDSEDPVFRPAALAAAARTSSEDMARWLLALDDPRLRASEKRDFLDGIMARSATREYGYEWAIANLDALVESGDGQFFARRLPQVMARFCSVEWAARIEADLGPRLAGTAAATELDRAIELVRNCGLLDDMMGDQIDAEFMELR